jgi:L-alanine-DL-glutamate epimerase-like enolase superfamily enzyme
MRAWLKKIDPAKVPKANHPTALGALECATLDAFARERKIPLRRLFGRSNKPVETDVTLSAWDTATTLKIARHYYKRGFRRFKIKVGKAPLGDDLKRIAALHAKFPRATLWIDANQGFSLADVERFVHVARANRWPVIAIEQPTPKRDLKTLARAQRVSPYPIYADESAGSVAMVKKIIRAKAARGVVVKIAKTGLTEALKIVTLARKNKLHTMISCMAESARGLTTSVQWAIGDGKFDWVDLDSFLLTGTTPRRSWFGSKGPWLF